MEHTNKNIYKKIVTGKNDFEYVNMMTPEGWHITVNIDEDIYCGYGYPYSFSVNNLSPDETAGIYYFSPKAFVDDHLRNYQEYEISNYGILYKSLESLHDYLYKRVADTFGKYDGFKMIAFLGFEDNDEVTNRNYQKLLNEYNNTNKYLNNYYYDKGIMIFSYMNNNTERKHAVSARIEAVDYSKWMNADESLLNDPYISDMAVQMYPNLRYDKDNGVHIYTGAYQTDWSITQFIEMDCMADDFEYIYNSFYLPTINRGVDICDDIWNDFEDKQAIIDEKNRALREEKKQVDEILAQARMDRLEANNQLYESIRKSREETYNILNQAYEHNKQTHDRMSEWYSDVYRGNTRFIDRYGHEHIVHTSDDYVYRRGREYLTSKTPLDLNYEWELLKKKY